MGDTGSKFTRRGAGALLGSAVAAVAVSGKAGAAEQEFRAQPRSHDGKRPNVLVILGDDLGWGDLGCYGAPEIRTPHLDGLARQGVRFTDAYSAAPVCSPTRFGLYTGRYPGRLRGGLEEPIDLPDERFGIPPGHPTLASLLASAGYTTALYGKWHCGYLPWFSPVKSGWQEFFGNFAGGMDYYSKLSYFGQHDLYEQEVPVESLDYYTDTLTERTQQFLRRKHDKPWLLNLNYTTPHWPWEAPGDTETSRQLTARLRAGEKQVLQHHDGGSLATYRKMVESLDSSIGAVLRVLRETGQERDTIVLFASDNGGERFSYVWPFSGGKGDLYEGGIRVPTLLRWPSRIRPRQVSAVPVVTQDWTATILEAAGVRPDPDHPLDGRSLAGYLLRGERLGETDLFWRTKQYRALRRGDWKYLRKPGAADALFDLSSDQHEQANLAGKRPDLLAQLRASWERIDAELLPYS